MSSIKASATRQSVCHLTSVHKYDDVRIFHKECCSLARAGYEVFIVAPGVKDKTINHDVNIRGVINSNQSRVSRMTSTVWKIHKRAHEINADIYHIHDPELLPIALLLKIRGKKVIYDVHEDLPAQLLTKPYLNKFSGRLLSFFMMHVENFICKKVDGIITATPYINTRFELINKNTININNYPRIDEQVDRYTDIYHSANKICYIGGISQIRGLSELLKSLEFCNIELLLAGNFESEDFESTLKRNKNWNKVNYKGYVLQSEVYGLMKQSICGIVTCLPCPNYINSQPTKMFEYMAAGLPVIASKFPLWQEIIEGNQCGMCVDPQNPEEIAEAINYIASHPVEAKAMGDNGLKAVRSCYNWFIEEAKLLSFYLSLANVTG